ncbi:MAG: hypothetical protein RMI30_02685 [Thermodesulfovibrio sp.]|nr:hypothetical protein [Thermodesulfovibrio sp.]MDW7998343.1 hypothetical protein [Thermodesulfovibrio sp.]
MLSIEQKEYIRKNAYIPEHLTDYVYCISQAEPFLSEEYIFYLKDSHLIFIGYPLVKTHSDKLTQKILQMTIEKFRPKTVAFIASFPLTFQKKVIQKASDFYYQLDISNFVINSSIRNTIKRALREVDIERNNKITVEHIELIDEFIKTHDIDQYTRLIFQKIPDYINLSQTVVLFNARDKKGNISAFSIADYGSDNYAFYMFNIRSHKNYVPGVSDLILNEIIKEARERGKSYMNLGLGINKGIEFFKKKWSGKPFLRYEFTFYKISHKISIIKFFKKIFN